MTTDRENPAIRRFREYLQINTMQPNPDYDCAFQFLRQQAVEIGLDFRVIESGVEGRPVGLMTWEGSSPEIKSILLSSHIDVVPVFPDQWKYDPFSAHKDENGDIFARGTQDMKCVTMWYLEVIRKLKSEGRKFARTIHMLFTTDEEVGSKPAITFSESDEFKKLNAEFGLDEGIANPEEKMRVFYAERSIWWVKVNCPGNPGHGSAFIENSAAKKLQYLINRFLDLRDEQEKKFKSDPDVELGSVTTVNMTMVEGGVQPNVVPANLSATFDVRLPPTIDFPAMEKQLKQWCDEAGEGVGYEMLYRGDDTEKVDVTENNPWWRVFSGACKAADIQIQKEIFPAGTDSRAFRRQGVDMLGFSPMNHTPILLHDHNEFLNEKVFLRGIDIYSHIIPALANHQP